jgi:Tubulin-specific chaperone C N-terminal domain
MDSTTASANFYSEFQVEKDGSFRSSYSRRPDSRFDNFHLAIQEQLSRSTEIDKAHLDQHFESLLSRINSLERKLTESTAFVPGYDQRQFSLVSRLHSLITTCYPYTMRKDNTCPEFLVRLFILSSKIGIENPKRQPYGTKKQFNAKDEVLFQVTE